MGSSGASGERLLAVDLDFPRRLTHEHDLGTASQRHDGRHGFRMSASPTRRQLGEVRAKSKVSIHLS
jgi:hypothetical protein